MDYKKFIKECGINNPKIEKVDIISFIKILDYLYCTYDLDRFSNIMSGFYKSADDIFNSFETWERTNEHVCNVLESCYKYMDSKIFVDLLNNL